MISKVKDEGHLIPLTGVGLQVEKVKGQAARSSVFPDMRCAINRERKVPDILKLVGRLPTPRAVTRISFKVKRSRSVTPPTNGETKRVS